MHDVVHAQSTMPKAPAMVLYNAGTEQRVGWTSTKAMLKSDVQLQGSQDTMQHFTAHGPELLRPQLHGLPECAWHDPFSAKPPAQTLCAASGCA